MISDKPAKTKRDRRNFSQAEKQRLYQEWKLSGLNRHKFCEKHDLVLSAFGKWCRKIANEGSLPTQSDWVPVVATPIGFQTEANKE